MAVQYIVRQVYFTARIVGDIICPARTLIRDLRLYRVYLSTELNSMPTRKMLFITHAEVLIDPTVPVPKWGLSDKGRSRHKAFNDSEVINTVTAIYCSGEKKAEDGAEILSQATRIDFNIIENLHENDRSATGFLPPPEFQATADLFFQHPTESIRGWERAVDAQSRIVSCVDSIIQNDMTTGDIAVVAHGGVGALLFSHLARVPISRSMDQPGGGGGNYFVFDIATRSLLHGWRDIAPISIKDDANVVQPHIQP